MIISITINTENDAFQNGKLDIEAKRILREFIKEKSFHSLESNAYLRDVNGNKCGDVMLILSDEEEIEKELLSSFDFKQFKTMSFEDMWQEIDIQNAYEEEWKERKETLKPIYIETYYKIKEDHGLWEKLLTAIRR